MSMPRPEPGPPILVARPELPPLVAYTRRLEAVWESRYLSNGGPQLREFEARLLPLLGAPQLSVVSSGALALELALAAAGASGEVITTSLSFAASANAIVRAGARPRFVDIEPVRMTIDPQAVEAAIGPDTSAILAVHVFGQACDVDALADIAARHKLPLIYDAAHAFGLRIDGQPIAAWGDFNAFSLHATKPFHAAEGGIVTARNAADKARIDRLANHGLNGEASVDEAGTNAKMSELGAALGLAMLDDIAARTAARAAIAERYRERLGALPGLILPPLPPAAHQTNYSFFVIRIDAETFGISAEAVRDELAALGIFTRRYFHPPLHHMPAFASATMPVLPVTERVTEQVLALPMYSSLSSGEVDRVCDALLWLGNRHSAS